VHFFPLRPEITAESKNKEEINGEEETNCLSKKNKQVNGKNKRIIP
jgi:hypothetical protein